MRFALAASASLLVVASVLACSDLGGLNGDEEPPTTTPPRDEAGLDGGDAATSVDGSPGGTFCASLAGPSLFCRDFDEGTPLALDFTLPSLQPDDGGTVKIDEGASVSAPAALMTRLEQGMGGCAFARVERQLQNPPTRTRYAFDVRIGGSGVLTSVSTQYFFLGLGDAADRCNVILVASDSGGNAFVQYAGAASESLALSRWPKQAKWSHVQVDVDRTLRTLDVFVDGTHAFDAPKPLLAACGVSLPISMQAGLFCESTPTAPKEARIDNLVVTAIP